VNQPDPPAEVKLSNAQLELLRLFERDLGARDLKRLKKLLERFAAELPQARRAKTAARSRKPAARIFRLKVTLLESRPAIWRRIEVPAEANLYHLHALLQGAMGWTNSHLHQFIWQDRIYTILMPELDQPDELEERDVRLYRIFRAKGDGLLYEYDFGDSWQHWIELEAVLEPDPALVYPRVTAGANACPPEDVGGIPGYYEFVKAIRSPRHRDYQQMFDWHGGAFDPRAFDRAHAEREAQYCYRKGKRDNGFTMLLWPPGPEVSW
jgi:hypothetical protein